MNNLKIAERPTAGVEGSAIGNILVQSGRLAHQDLNRILALQAKENVLFGEAAVSLGILSSTDVRWALANQYSYPGTGAETEQLAKELLVHEPSDRRVESFRSIRSSLILAGVGKGVMSIAVMSPGEGEGRTFIASNLAVAFAQLGVRTLLVDLNFRAPRVHSLFQLKNACGASSVIIRRAIPDDAIQSVPSLGMLHILPSGPEPPNPLELLSWEETKELVSALKGRYQVVIVDTPAFGKTADARVISGFCDAVVLVALKGRTVKPGFGQMKLQLERAGAQILGAVMNETV